MQKLVWQNAKGEELDLTGGNYGITEWEGFSNTGLNIQSQQVPFQDGGVFLDALMEQRELTVTLAIQDNNNLTLRYQQRRELISALNPKLGEGYLIYTNDFISKRIKCIPNIPIFETHNSDTAGTPKASLSWVACEPYWEDLEETVVNFDTSENPVIENEGDIPAQLEIVFKSGNVTNPSIIRTNGNKKIQYNGTLNRDLFINTKQGQKTVQTLDVGMEISPFGLGLKNIKYSPKANIYVGITGSEIVVSKDCVNWELVYNAGGATFLEYAEEKNLFCVTSGGLTSRAILTSSDGINWTSNLVADFNELYYTDLKYFESLHKFYILFDSGPIAYSEDGINWTVVSTGAFIPSEIEYSDDLQMFIMADRESIRKSSDGITWTSYSTSGIINYCVKYIKEFGMFVVGGSNGSILTSVDGTNWVTQVSGITTTLYWLAYSRRLGKVFASGWQDQNSVVLNSENGINWESQTYTNTSLSGLGVLDELGYIWASTDDFISYSPDGNNFVFPDYSSLVSGVQEKKTIYIDEKEMWLANWGGKLDISPDGINWQNIDTGGKTVICMAYSKHLDCVFVGLLEGFGQYYILKSQDLVNWTTEEVDFEIVNIVSAENQEKVVVVNTTGTVITTDGENWTEHTATGMGSKNVYSEDLNLFVTGVGYSGIWTSPDGITWTQRISDTRFNDISVWKNGFVALPDTSEMTTLYSSQDGITWITRTCPQISRLYYSEFEGALYGVWPNPTHYVYKTYNLASWEELEEIDFYCNVGVANSIQQILFIAVYEFKIYYTTTKGLLNVIQNLSYDSDMNLNLELGENTFRLNQTGGSFTCSLKYRQKYIGV